MDEKYNREECIRNMMDRYQEENRGIQIIELETFFPDVYERRKYYQYLVQYCPASAEACALTDVMLETLIHHCLQAAGDEGGDREDPRGEM